MAITAWNGSPTGTVSPSVGGNIKAWNTPVAKTMSRVVPIARAAEAQTLRQQQLAKGINNPQSLVNLQAGLKSGQVTPQQFTQQFAKASKGATGATNQNQAAPAPFSKLAAIPGATETAVANLSGERPVAQVIARVLPGGQNDLRAENTATNSNLKSQQFINNLLQTQKITPKQAIKIQQSTQRTQQDNANLIKSSAAIIPSRGRAAASVAAAAGNVLTGGSLESGGDLLAPVLKGTGTIPKIIRGGTATGLFGATGGANTAASGGTSRQVVENSLLSAAFPAALHGLVKGAEVAGAAKAIRGNDQGVNDLINNTKTNALVQQGKPPETPLETPKQSVALPTKSAESLVTKSTTEPAATLSNSETASVKTPKASLASNESGSVPLGDVQAMIEKHQASTKFSGDLQASNDKLEGSKAVIAEDTGKAIDNRAPISNSDKQLLQNYRDQKAAGLTPDALPQRLQKEDTDVTALNEASQSNDAELARLNGQEQKAQTIESRDASTYTHREAKGKGTSLDYLEQGDRKNPLSVSGFGKTTPASKNRTYMAVTDEQGNRRVVAVKNSVLKNEQGRKVSQGKLVQAIDDGGKTTENLGKLKLQTNQDFLDKELSPYQTKVKNLQKEYDTLSKVKTKGGVSEARIDALAKKSALLEDPGNLSTITKSEARSLQQSKLKLRELTRVKPTTTNATSRLETIRNHLIEMNNEISKISNKYDPETLDQKVFVGKDGKNYTIGQATTDEITKATGQKYYTDPKLMALKNYADSRTALENAKFIESIKQHPDFDTFASEPGKTAPKGWKGVTGLDQFRGYKFDPKVREVLTDLVNKSSDERSLSQDVSQVLRQAIVYFPLKHSINEGFTYAVDRGLSSYANPAAYKRGAQALVKAFHDVTNQSEDFQAVQKAGAHMTTGGEKALSSSFEKALKELNPDHPAVIDVAKQWGTSPVRVYKAIQNLSVWELQDVLNMARINERMAPKLLSKGESLEDAVAHTKRYNLQYQVPSRVGGPLKHINVKIPGGETHNLGRGLSRALRSPVVFFGRYKYDQVRILSNIIKDTVNLKSLVKTPGQNIQAADKLAALAVGTALVWPIVDKGVQKLTGDKNAHVTAPGVGGLVEAGEKVAKGQESAGQAVSGQVSIATPATLALDIKNNMNSFTGKPISDPNASPVEQGEANLKYIEGQLSPFQKFSQGKENATSKVTGVILSMAGASLPKNSSADTKLNSYKYDTLPIIQAQAKALAAKGDTQGAIEAINKYNQSVSKALQAAATADGTKLPNSAQSKKAGYYYDPTLSTVQGWAKTTPKLGTLQTILNTKLTPTKGQPGYKAYEKQQALKAKRTKFFNRENPQANAPVVGLP